MPYYRRDWFTGKLEEVPSTGAPRSVIAKTSVPASAVDPRKKSGSVWGRPQVFHTKAVLNEQAGEFNEGAPAGVRYVPGADGWAKLECDSRAARKAECKRQGWIDKDGGYGDHTEMR